MKLIPPPKRESIFSDAEPILNKGWWKFFVAFFLIVMFGVFVGKPAYKWYSAKVDELLGLTHEVRQ